MTSTYERNALTFALLRAANKARLADFKNARGEYVHRNKAPWLLSQWGCALAGEVGEALNIIKKYERGDFTQIAWEEKWQYELECECADIAVYLDLLAIHANISLEDAIRHKFNVVSNRINSEIRL